VTPLVWANIPLMLLFIVAIVGIPMWMVIRRPDRAPDHSEARAYLRDKSGLAAADEAAAQVPAMTAAVPPGPRMGRWRLSRPRGAGAGRRPATTAPGNRSPAARITFRSRSGA
jgi:hypothetical protein